MTTPGSDVTETAANAGSSALSLPDRYDDQPAMRAHTSGLQAYRKYRASGDLQSLEAAIQSFRLVVDMTQNDSPKKAGTLANLVTSLQARFESVGQLQDLEEAITLEQRADTLTPDDSPNKAGLLKNLAILLTSRFKRSGRSEDIEQAINLGTRAITLVPDSSADKPALLNNLGISLKTRFEHSGNHADLDKAISLQNQAIELTPDGDKNKPSQLTNLGNSFQKRFEQLGNIDDIERAITFHGRAVDLTRDNDPNKLSRLSNAGNSLQARFSRLGDIEDLSRAIQFKSRAVVHASDGHPSKPMWLNNLANSLQGRFEKTGDAEDLEQAIAHQTHAVELTPDGHLIKASRLSNLGTMLQTRFKQLGRLEDLDAAITHQTNAVKLAPEGYSGKSRWFYNLSNSLLQRYDQTGNAVDLEGGIRYSTDSVKLMPRDHAERAQNLRSLGLRFLTRLRSPHVQTDDAMHAMNALVEAMQHTNSPPFERLRAAWLYADLLAEFSHLLSAPPSLPLLESYKHILDLIPQCVWLGNSAHGRYTSHQMRVAGYLTNEAAAAAITAGQYKLALEWLEAGRSVISSQVLRLRTPLHDLRRLHPKLADDLQQVSQALEHVATGADRDGDPLPLTTSSSTETQFSPGIQAQSSHSYALRYDILIAQVRKLEGFEAFMRPKTLSQLAGTCVAGPVVVINMHRSRCDALILYHPEEVQHVPLPSFSYSHALQLYSELVVHFPRGRFRNALHDDQSEEDRGAFVFGEDGIHHPMYRILADLWKLVVKPILDIILSLPVPNTHNNRGLTHITWCPTGPLMFLPLHAAGIYHHNGTAESLMDHAISSYAPTLESLLKPRTQVDKTATRPSLSPTPRVLVVSQPATPGCQPIPGTRTEAKIVASSIEQFMQGSDSTIKALDDKDGTVEAVLEGMETHDWIHLACHGIQDRDDSTNSAFLLYNGKLTLNNLMMKSFPNAELAVLSACQTATGDAKLAEEAVHLAAGMLNVGYKSVIGTMWSISDSSAPVLMGEFYRVLMKQVCAGEEIRPAYALHEAVKLLRAKCNQEYNRWHWVPFVHFGM